MKPNPKVLKLSVQFNEIAHRVRTGGASVSAFDDFLTDVRTSQPADIQKAFAKEIENGIKLATQAMASMSQAEIEKFQTAFHNPDVVRGAGKTATFAKEILGNEAGGKLVFVANEFSKLTEQEYQDPKSLARIYKQAHKV